MGLVDGVTTNPSLIAKSGRKYKDVVVEICEMINGPISAEVLSTTYDEMMAEAREWHKLHKNIVVKLPLIPDGLKGVRTCVQEGIRTNVTLCFSPNQALLAAKAGASYISPFIGRLDDVSETGMELIEAPRAIDRGRDLVLGGHQRAAGVDAVTDQLDEVDVEREGGRVAVDVAHGDPNRITSEFFWRPRRIFSNRGR